MTPTRGPRIEATGPANVLASTMWVFSGIPPAALPGSTTIPGRRGASPCPSLPSVTWVLPPPPLGWALRVLFRVLFRASAHPGPMGYGDDHTADHPASPIVAYRVHNEPKFDTGSRRSGPGSRSPALGTRTPSTPTSPLHPRMAAVGLEPLIGKSEDCKNQYHPLPLPPGSPSSPSQPSTRTDGVTESPPDTPSSWKKGSFLEGELFDVRPSNNEQGAM